MDEKKNVSIAGSGSFTGGSYGKVEISGSGKCSEPFTADSFKASGSANLAAVEAGKLEISGSARFSGSVTAKKMSVSGSCVVEDACEANELEIAGSMHTCKSLRGTNGTADGSIRVDGDMEFERLTISGSVHVSGLLNAEALTLHLGGRCEVGEIGGTEIFVDVPPFHLGFLKKLLGAHAISTLKCGSIEGETIRLENTICDTVRGKNVVIGPGCKIGLVEASGELTIDPDSSVQQCAQVE